jgi:hypothetical protein
MIGASRVSIFGESLSENPGILTLIGLTHAAYPEEFDTYALINSPDQDRDLTLVFDDIFKIKFGGGDFFAEIQS